MFGISQPTGIGFTPAATRSLPVYTASTPLIFVAAVASIRTMRACACGLRTKAAVVVPGIRRSSTKVPLPVIKRGSSRRLMLAPKNFSMAHLACAA